MGYGIIYVPLGIVRNKLKTVEEQDGYDATDTYSDLQEDALATSYLSYNFSNKSLCGRKFTEYMYLPDIAGQSTDVLAEKLSDLLELLMGEGFTPEIPEETWETQDMDGKMTEKKMDGWTPDMRVFTYHVQRLRDECRKYKRCVMILDYNHPISLTEEEMKDDTQERKEELAKQRDVLERKKALPEVYYQHPIKGTVLVDNFALCTEIYVMAHAKKDPRAKQWYELCWQMPDAPKRT